MIKIHLTHCRDDIKSSNFSPFPLSTHRDIWLCRPSHCRGGVYFLSLESEPSYANFLEWGPCNSVPIQNLVLKKICVFPLTLRPLPFLWGHAQAILLAPQEGWEVLEAELPQRSRLSPAQIKQRLQPTTDAWDSPASTSQAQPRSAKLQPSQHISNKVLYATKILQLPVIWHYYCSHNKTHTNIAPLAMAIWSFMLRKIHIQAK